MTDTVATLFIDGQWVPSSSGETRTVICPADQSEVGVVSEATAEDVDTAMRLGTNYPKGPHAWLDELGRETVAAHLRELDRAFPGGRYRLSPALEG